MEDKLRLALDARGMKCPLPVLRARKILKSAPVGATLIVQATDPGAPADFRHFSSVSETELLSIETVTDGFVIMLKKNA